MWYVYILRCDNDLLYTGITNDVETRMELHLVGKGAKFTKTNKPTEILYSEEFRSRSDAARRERQLKGWSRGKKLALISGDIESLKEL